MAQIRDGQLQKVMVELSDALDGYAEELGLDPDEQLRELTAAITVNSLSRQADAEITSKDKLLSRLLEVSARAIIKMDEEVSPNRFVGAREALHALRASLKELYMNECISY